MNFKLDLLAKIVGNSMGISVMDGAGFAIGKDRNGGLVITIPPMAIGNEEDAAIVRSGLCHEAVGHGRHTDFTAKRGPTALHLAMENVLEDARIEKAAWKIYPKTRQILGNGMEALLKQNKIKRSHAQNSPAEAAAVAVLLRLMVEELGYCQKTLDWQTDWAHAVSSFGDETMNKVWALAVDGHQVGSTAEVIRYAAKIVKLLQDGFEQQQKPKQQQRSSGEKGESKPGAGGDGQPGNGDPSADDDDGKPSSGDESDENGSKPNQSGNKSGKKGDKSDKGEKKDGKDASGKQDGRGGQQDEAGESCENRDETSSGGGSSHEAHAPSPLDLRNVKPEQFDRGDLLKSQIESKTQRTNKIAAIKRPPGDFVPSGDGKAAAQRLKSFLAQRLMAVVEDEDDSLVENGMLASHRLVDARLGDRFAFTEPGKPGERLDTAFSLLIDMSGSMQGSCDQACLSATWAIGDTLNGYSGMGLSFTVSSFNGALYVLKDWDNPWKRGAPLASYHASGSTFTVGAVENRLAHLIKRREPRKVLYLITDGDIGDLQPLVNTAREMDVEIVVMMIGNPDNKPKVPYIKRFSVVRPDDIARSMMKTVTELF